MSLPGGESLRGFVLVTVLVEKAAVPGIKVSSLSTGLCLPFIGRLRPSFPPARRFPVRQMHTGLVLLGPSVSPAHGGPCDS